MIRPTMTVLIAVAVLVGTLGAACSSSTEESEPSRGTAATVSTTEEEEQSLATPASVSTSGGSLPPATIAAVPYFGEESIEERIINADAVVTARLDRMTADVVTVTGDYEGWAGKYFVALKFHVIVSEYLRGSGGENITALTIQGDSFDTRQEAEAALPGIAASRDTRWDDREAILFLQDEDSEGIFDESVQGADEYFTWDIELQNRNRRLWLPSAGTAATGDSKEFLLAVPGEGASTPTITIGELKRRIAAIDAELAAGDGSDAYTDCLKNKYRFERIERVRATQPGYTGPSYRPYWSGAFASGQPAGSVLYEYDYGFVYTEDGIQKKTRLWIDGRDAPLLAVEEGDPRPESRENRHRFSYYVVSTRPIPATVLEFNQNYGGYIDCGDTSTFEITAKVFAPGTVLHEALFDPVTVGSTVVAGGGNGVLSPAVFTESGGRSSTIDIIAWEASDTNPGQGGMVKMGLRPVDAITGRKVDFIELDGSVSLSLDVADAVVDEENDTLSWTAESQPWEEGDLLMVRIHGEPPSCSGGTVIPNPTGSPYLVNDCEALILAKDALAGTGQLNWSVDVPITSWDGITVSGTPKRITGLSLPSHGLNGRIPAELSTLTYLSSLDLSDNQLTGHIPSELGNLRRITRLRLAGNDFRWCVPIAFQDVKDSDHNDLDLFECVKYGPGGPASEGPAIFASVSAGDRHTCGVRADGSLVCWGNPSRLLTDSPAGEFASVSVGGDHTCGLRTDGIVECWNHGAYGPATVLTGTFTSISAGASHTCGIETDGSVACYGSDESGQSSPPPGGFASVSAGGSHTCGVKANGSVACWGSNGHGESSPPDGRYSAVSAGESHTCGIKTDGHIVCWGSYERGHSPPSDGEFASVSVGGYHTCGVRVDGTATCWSHDHTDQISPPDSEFLSISVGLLHTCGVRTDGTASCWGYDWYGPYNPPGGVDDHANSTVNATAIVMGESVAGTIDYKGDSDVFSFQTRAGQRYQIDVSMLTMVDSVVMLTDNHGQEIDSNDDYGDTLASRINWMANYSGEHHVVVRDLRDVGTYTMTVSEVNDPDGNPEHPRLVSTEVFTSVSAATFHTCGLKADGSIVCWGADESISSTPPGRGFTSVSVRYAHGCGLKSDGSVVCWGANYYGQSTPVEGRYSYISVGHYHTCGVKADGALVCWGSDDYGESSPPEGKVISVGTGSFYTCWIRTDRSIACLGREIVGPGTPPTGQFTHVSVGSSHACGIRVDSAVVCWGYHYFADARPVEGEFVSISAGGFHTCGIRADGSVACWGSNTSGQSTPPDGKFASVSGGWSHTCGVRTDGKVECWGDIGHKKSMPP